MSTSAELIATHLNAPYGVIITAADVRNTLLSGKVVAATENAQAILHSVFIETEPQLLMRAAVESGIDLQRLHCLYQETLASGMSTHPHWERLFGEML